MGIQSPDCFRNKKTFISSASIRHRLLFSLQHRLTHKTNKHEQSIQSMAQAGQKSERHGAYTRNGDRGNHQDERLQSLLQQRAGNQGDLHARLSVRLQESLLHSVGFQLHGVGLRNANETFQACAMIWHRLVFSLQRNPKTTKP